MEKITFETEDGTLDFFVLSQTRINGTDYLLVSDTDDDEAENEAYILKDVSSESDTFAEYVFVENEQELDAVYKVFVEELGDEDIDFIR